MSKVTLIKPVFCQELTVEEAKKKLHWWNETQRTSVASLKKEPPLSLLLSILLFKHRHEQGLLDGWENNPLHHEILTFLTQIRIARILQAVKSGEADNRFRQVLQCELNKTGGFGPIWSQMPRFRNHQAYLRIRILEEFEKSVLRSTPTARDWKGFPENIYASCKFLLEEILSLPTRDPFHERDCDFA